MDAAKPSALNAGFFEGAMATANALVAEHSGFYVEAVSATVVSKTAALAAVSEGGVDGKSWKEIVLPRC